MTLPPRLLPQAGPGAWAGADLTPADWMLPFGAEEAAALDAPPDRPAPPRLAALLQAVADRLETGRGVALLRGLKLDGLDAGAALQRLGARLGTALPQDAAGSLVRALEGPGVAAAAPVRFHADPADAVALLCLQQAPQGGRVTLVSAPSLHNALLKADRAALAILHEGLPQRIGATLPVFSTISGAFVGRCDHAAIDDAALSPPQRAALAALEAAAAAPGQALAIPLHPGDLLLWNPHLVWKLAHPGEDAAPGATRHLLRLWLAMPNSRALPESFRAVFGETAAGAPRGGVARGETMVGG